MIKKLVFDTTGISDCDVTLKYNDHELLIFQILKRNDNGKFEIIPEEVIGDFFDNYNTVREVDSLEEAKEKCQEIFQNFVNMFLE